MQDSFALLGEARRPWLDVGLLKESFLKQCAQAHPDRFTSPKEKAAAQSRFAELNAAHETLRSTKRRLQHLLTLERGVKPSDIHDIPAALADVFVEIMELVQRVDRFLAARQSLPSALLKAREQAAALEWWEKVEALRARLNAQQQALDASLQQLSVSWRNPTPEIWEKVEQAYHQASYLSRWRGLLQERSLRLSQ